METKVLIVDDETDIVQALIRALADFPAKFLTTSNPVAALDLVKRESPQVVITDLKMPEMSGMDLLSSIKEIDTRIQVVLITGFGTIEDAVTAMRRGAYDFVSKPFKKQEIWVTLSRALEKADLLSENVSLKKKLSDKDPAEFIWGANERFREILDQAKRAARSRATILIQGESGTGKEVMANYLVRNSDLPESRFIKVNCAAIPETLLESELFGHKKGAFTGAVQDKPGKFTEAHQGTLFLDEVGEIPLTLQPKLLRALQEGEITPLGGTQQKVQVRIIVATNRDLRTLVKEGRFREDLFYRLYVIPITLPPLRHRIEDLPSLVAHFLSKHGKKSGREGMSIEADCLEKMRNYSWPGNIRELENALERAIILSPSTRITSKDLPLEILDSSGQTLSTELNLIQGNTLEEMELHIIQRYLDKNKGDKVKTADELGISVRTIYRKMEFIQGSEEKDEKTDSP